METQFFYAGTTSLKTERLSFIDAGDHAIEVANYYVNTAAGDVKETGK